MPALLVKCQSCRKLTPTGMSFDEQSFKSTNLTNNKTKCRNCGAEVVWSKKDVDPSSFTDA